MILCMCEKKLCVVFFKDRLYSTGLTQLFFHNFYSTALTPWARTACKNSTSIWAVQPWHRVTEAGNSDVVFRQKCHISNLQMFMHESSISVLSIIQSSIAKDVNFQNVNARLYNEYF